MKGITPPGHIYCCWLLLAACLVAVSGSALAADLVVSNGATGSGPDGTNCAAAGYTLIQDAIDAAATGDRVLVCAGTYTPSQLHISKGLTLIGAGPGQTVIDAQGVYYGTGTGHVGTLAVDAPNDGEDVSVSGLTIKNFSRRKSGDVAFGIHVQSAANATFSFDNLALVGQGGSGFDYGFYVEKSPQLNVALTHSSVTNTQLNAVQFEQIGGAVTVTGNQIALAAPAGTSKGIVVLTHSTGNKTNPMPQVMDKPVIIADNQIDAGAGNGITIFGAYQTRVPEMDSRINDLHITGNQITNVGKGGINLFNDSLNGTNGQITRPEISDNTLTAAPGTPADSQGITLAGLITDAVLQSNVISGFADAIVLDKGQTSGAALHEPTHPELAYNRIANNASGLKNSSSAPVDATNNWWGCNTGPNGGGGCNKVEGSAVSFDPWLILTISASPGTIFAGGDSSTITADLLTNSNGVAAPRTIPDGTDIGFATDHGSIPASAETRNGQASVRLISDNTQGTTTASATLDAQTVNTAIKVAARPPVLSLDLGPVDFGSQTVGATTTRSVALHNSVGDSIALPSIQVTGSGFSRNGDTHADDCGSTLAANDSCKIYLDFSPSAEGDFSGMLSVNGGQATARLEGKGVVAGAGAGGAGGAGGTQGSDNSTVPGGNSGGSEDHGRHCGNALILDPAVAGTGCLLSGSIRRRIGNIGGCAMGVPGHPDFSLLLLLALASVGRLRQHRRNRRGRV